MSVIPLMLEGPDSGEQQKRRERQSGGRTGIRRVWCLVMILAMQGFVGVRNPAESSCNQSVGIKVNFRLFFFLVRNSCINLMRGKDLE